MRALLPVVLTLFAVPSVAQDPTLAPDLRAALSEDLADTTRAQILVKLCFNLTRSQPDSALYYGEQGLALAERIKDAKSIADARNNLGWLGCAVDIIAPERCSISVSSSHLHSVPLVVVLLVPNGARSSLRATHC
ncbi:MAG: hypothetical protein IPO17_08860 [Flavobacteriales bacterium]|nr:hypothetical protein [Flavobacteriales bacterium]